MLTSLAARLFFSIALVALPDPANISGVVVDQHGRPLPRARVQVTTAAGAAVAFTNADGTFAIAVTPASDCRVVASLTGFQDARADCTNGAALQLTLAVAPIEEHVIVSATRTDTPSGQVASGVTVFTADDITGRQEPPVADLLRSAPGTMVVRSGALGNVTSIFVRGGESNYNKVLLDGIPLNEPGGTFDFSNVTSEGLDRVELVRGANSALYGSDAMTSVIQLFTRRATSARPEARLDAEGGSFSTFRGSASIAGRSGPADYSAGGARLSTDNEVSNNAFRNTTLFGTAGLTLPRGAVLRFVGRTERGEAGVPGQTAFGRPDLDGSYSRHEGVWGASFDQTIGALRQRAAYGLSTTRQESSDLGTDPAYTPAYGGSAAPFAFTDFAYDSRTALRRHHASYQADWTTATSRFGTHIDTALADWDGERATLTDVLAGDATVASRNNAGVSFQHQALWSRAFATAGVRVEHNDSFGTAVVPRASIAYYARTGAGTVGSTRLTASGGLGIKEPTILQSFSTSPYFLGNPNLEPERARTIDAGIEQRFAADRVRVEATVFANRYRNIISLGPTDDLYRAQYFNIGLTQARGAELSGDVALAGGLRAKGGYTFTASRILESTSSFSEVFAVGQWAFRRPRHNGFAEISWLGARLSGDLAATFVGRRVDSDFSSLEPALVSNTGYARWDARAAARVHPRMSLTLAIDNLTGARYMDPLGYPALGRAVRAGVRATF